jgi:hypothetical protein
MGTNFNFTFNFTNDNSGYDKSCKWRDDAIADGWEHKATYDPQELESRACSLSKLVDVPGLRLYPERRFTEGLHDFRALIITRANENDGKWKYEAGVSVWGPDGLALFPGEVYDMNFLIRGLKVCHFCHKEGVDTSRVGFASRCCRDCYPEAVKEAEYPGWNK